LLRRIRTTFADRPAAWALLNRGAIVGVNYVVMLGLALLLGLKAFGALVLLWSLALILATVVSLGAPLILLQRLTGGGGFRVQQLLGLVFVGPVVVGTVCFLALSTVFPAVAWAAVMVAAFGLHLIFCLGSVLRAAGSLQWSMVLRDAGPSLWLGFSAVSLMGSAPESLIFAAALGMIGTAAGVAFWYRRLLVAKGFLRATAPAVRVRAYWATSVLGTGVAQADMVVGGFLIAPEAYGLYALLRRMANLVALPVSVATWVSAGPIGTAFASGKQATLQIASQRAGYVALVPGTFLFVGALVATPFLPIVLGRALDPADIWVWVILLSASFLQVWFAAGYTVATLCGAASETVRARGLVIALYMGAASVLISFPDPLWNAIAITLASGMGSFFLWWRLRLVLGVDTSAMAVFAAKKGGEWKLS